MASRYVGLGLGLWYLGAPFIWSYPVGFLWWHSLVLGAAIITLVPELARELGSNFTDFRQLIFSGVLVFNLFSAALSRERNQIGVMKALGASGVQIRMIHFCSVMVLGLAGLALGIPLATATGGFYADFIAPMMNFAISDYSTPVWIYVVLVTVGLGIPLLAAAVPIWQASRTAACSSTERS